MYFEITAQYQINEEFIKICITQQLYHPNRRNRLGDEMCHSHLGMLLEITLGAGGTGTCGGANVQTSMSLLPAPVIDQT